MTKEEREFIRGLLSELDLWVSMFPTNDGQMLKYLWELRHHKVPRALAILDKLKDEE